MNNHLEHEEITSLMRHEGFRVYFRNILSVRRRILIDHMNRAIKNHEDREVGEYFARINEVEGIFDLVKNRLKAIQEEEDNGTDA